MATLCKNCGHPLVFDPQSQRLLCSACNSKFDPYEVESEEKQYLKDQEALSMNSVLGTESKEFMNCYVYTCSACGGEIIINDSEASTNCIYCGNSNVVFSRVMKQKAPECILPFSITKERAIELIHQKIDKGFLVPKEIKEFKPENVRGIYIPYWITNAEHSEAAILSSEVKSGKNSKTVFHGRSGNVTINNFPVDASQILSDESSQRLEPFDMKNLKPFDEDFLLGFYSNISDVTYGNVRDAVNLRACQIFEESALNDITGSSRKVVNRVSSTHVMNDMICAMLPCWFVTFTYQQKHHTILVNGDTGKIVCGLPWNKKRFVSLLIGIGAGLSLLTVNISHLIVPAILDTDDGDGIKLLAMIGVGVGALFLVGWAKLKRVLEQIRRTQASSIFNFVKKRQE